MSLLRFHGVRRSAWVALWMSAGAVAIVGCGGEATTDAESTTATASALTDEKEQAICNQLLVPENAMLHAPCGSYKETCTNGTAWGIYGDQFCADCRDTDGNAKHSCVTKAGCPEWSLWNDTGALRCGTKPEVTPQPVSTVQGLVDALAEAKTCSRISIADSAVLDLTPVLARGGLRVPAGVTVAGGGGDGAQAGPILRMRRIINKGAMFLASGADVRITGLRIQGPDRVQGIRDRPSSSGIKANGQHGLQVDHCELSGWPNAAVNLAGSRYAFVHHNSIHHNRREGLGYGVVLAKGSSADIQHNDFDANRHCVAGTGDADIVYVARYNKIGTDLQDRGQVFDMHGMYEQDRGRRFPQKPWAGCMIEIYNNTVLGKARPHDAIIRGIPASARGAEIHDNCFANAEEVATEQWTDRGAVDWDHYLKVFPDRHFHVKDNKYGVSNGTCHLAP